MSALKLVEPLTHPLDTETAREKLARFMQWWHECYALHGDNRIQQAIDADFYDGLQYSQDDINELAERGQAAHVYNKTAQHINWLLGSERRTRVDFKVHPRKAGDRPAAEAKTKLLKYTDDVNKAQFARSRAFEDCVKVGVGWLEDGVRSDPFDEPLFTRYESWRNMWYDMRAVESDLSDARYLWRVKYLDTDIAEAMFPDRVPQIRAAALDSDLFQLGDEDDLYGEFNQSGGLSGRASLYDAFHIGNRRSRVRLLECWYREPATAKVVQAHTHSRMEPELLDRISPLHGQPYQSDPLVDELLERQYLSLYDAVRMKMRCAIMTTKDLLQDMSSPYRHDKFPFTPIWAYRRDRDRLPYGPIRNMRDPQEDLNKRRSKALYLLSTNKVVADDDAVEDWDELEEQAAHPAGIIKKKPGSFLEFISTTELAEQHVTLMTQDAEFLESASGVTNENLGYESNAISGTAIDARTNQGSVVTAALFDNLRLAVQLQGEKRLSMIEQFMQQPKILRIIGDDGTEAFERINYPVRDEAGGIQVENPITDSQADFVIDTQQFSETVRMAMSEQLMTLMGQMDSNVALNLLDIVIDIMDVPKKDEIARRIRKLNGQINPDSPNAKAELAEKDAAEQAEQAELQRERTLLQDKTRADIDNKDAFTAQKRMDTLAKSSEIAELINQFPQLAPALDQLFKAMSTAVVDPIEGSPVAAQSQE